MISLMMKNFLLSNKATDENICSDDGGKNSNPAEETLQTKLNKYDHQTKTNKVLDIVPKHEFIPLEWCEKDGLGKRFDLWEVIAARIPHLLAVHGALARYILQQKTQLEGIIDDTDPGEKSFDSIVQSFTRPQLERAMLLLSTICHAYLYDASQKEPDNKEEGQGQESSRRRRLIRGLAVPWCAIANRLGLPPIATYYTLTNCNIINYMSGSIVDETNMKQDAVAEELLLRCSFLGGPDETGFFTVTAEMEAQAGPAVYSLQRAQQILLQGHEDDDDVDAGRAKEEMITDLLEKALPHLKAFNKSFAKMSTHCDPHVFFHRIRPFVNGWSEKKQDEDGNDIGGLIYEGCFDDEPQYFNGASGAQSPLILALDALLDIQHESKHSKDFLSRQLMYIPEYHRKVLQSIQESPSIRQYIHTQTAVRMTNTKLDSMKMQNDPFRFQEVFNECIDEMVRFRTQHLQFVARYIITQKQKANDKAKKPIPQQQQQQKNTLSASKREEPSGARTATTASKPPSSSLRGTGGTSIIPLLKASREETQNAKVGGGRVVVIDGSSKSARTSTKVQIVAKAG